MKPAQLLLAYQRLVERERELRDEIEQVEAVLTSDPNVVHAEETLATARASRDAIQLRLRESDRERETPLASALTRKRPDERAHPQPDRADAAESRGRSPEGELRRRGGGGAAPDGGGRAGRARVPRGLRAPAGSAHSLRVRRAGAAPRPRVVAGRACLGQGRQRRGLGAGSPRVSDRVSAHARAPGCCRG